MQVVSACSLGIGSIRWQPRPGVWVLTVVCKATCVLLPGESVLADDQDPVNEADDHWNDDERRSLHAPGDLAPFKPRADVFLVGHAYAPRGQPVAALSARLIVGEVDKTVEVCADRVWTQDGHLREGARFTRMPLRYERAGGGPQTSNPVGVRVDAAPDRYGQVPIPNLQPPGYHVTQPGEAVPPVGFGPIAPAWPGRAAKLYGAAAGWDPRAIPRQPLPPGIDPGFFNAAPPDQQVGELRDNERLVLENLHLDHARLVTSLPGISPRAVMERPGAADVELRLRCDTLSIDTDRGVCTLVWRGQVMLAHRDEAGRVVVTAGGAAPGVSAAPAGSMETETLPLGPPPEPARRASRMAATTLAPGRASLQFRDALPFVASVVEPAPRAPAPPPAEEPSPLTERAPSSAATLVPWLAKGSPPAPAPVLPFAAAPPSTAPLSPSWSPSPSPSLAPLPEAFSALRFGPELPSAWSGIMRAPEPLPISPPLPPPTWAPVSQVEPPAAPPALVTPTPEPPPPVEPPAPAPALAEPEETEPQIADYPIECCARIDARLARRPPDAAETLRAEDLTPDGWEMVHTHWANAMRAEAERGKKALLQAYDAAYVAQLEDERGELGADDYARLSVAAERGRGAELLAEMGLPREALIRIRRVWLTRIVKSPQVAATVRAAMRSAAEAG